MAECVEKLLEGELGDGLEPMDQTIVSLRSVHWDDLPAHATPQALTHACTQLMQAEGRSRIAGACAYAALLGAESTPALSLLDSIALSHCFRRIKEAFPLSSPSDAHAFSSSTHLLFHVIDALRAFATNVPLSDQTENLRSLVDTLCHLVLASHDHSGAASSCLISLLNPRHGDPIHCAAMIFQRLTPALVGSKQCTKEGFKATVAIAERIAREVPVVQPAVCAQLRQACIYCSAKSTTRKQTVNACSTILSVLPRLEAFSFATFVCKLSRAGKPNQRLFAVELSSAMLERVPGAHTPPSLHTDEDETMLGGNEKSQDINTDPWSSQSVQVLIERSSDRVVSIRAKALSSLRGILLNARDDSSALSALLCFIGPRSRPLHTDSAKENEEMPEEEPAQIEQPPKVLEERNHNTEKHINMTALLRKRALDSKGNVRKAALQAHEAWISIRQQLDTKDLAIFARACREHLLTVRKQGMMTLATMVNAFPTRADVVRTFAASVIPLTADSESIIQERAVEELKTHIFDRVVRLSKSIRMNNSETINELNMLLESLAAYSSGGNSLFVAVDAIAKRSQLEKQHVNALEACIGNESLSKWGSYGLWAVLQAMSAQQRATLPSKTLKEEWRKCNEEQQLGNVDSMVLRCIGNSSRSFSAKEAKQLSSEIRRRLVAFDMPLTSVSAHVYALSQLDSGYEKNEKQSSSAWASELCAKAHGILEEYVTGKKAMSRHVKAALFSVGEVATSSPNAPSDSLKTHVQALLAPTMSKDGGHSKSNPLESSETINAHAWITLGKLCMVDEKLAKRCVPLLVQELDRSMRPAVRNNILIILADLCVKYTALVDPHVLRIAASVRDPCELVRRQAVALLDSLLHKDYLKWKGPLFIRFCRVLADESKAVRSLAHKSLVSHLSAKVPLMAYNHFVEVLFALNNKSSRDGNDYFSGSTDRERERFVLEGSSESCRTSRMQVYTMLLNTMSPEHRVATAAKVSNDVLASVSDDALPLEEYIEVVHDSLAVLASSAMSVREAAKDGGHTGGDNEDEEDGQEGSQQQQQQQQQQQREAKKRLVSTLAHSNLTENIVPVLIEIKHKVEANRKPLSGKVMECFMALLKDHESSIESILAADQQLAKEVRFELQASAAKKAAVGKKQQGRQHHRELKAKQQRELNHGDCDMYGDEEEWDGS